VTNKKYLLMFLLTFCIGFAPLQSISAGNLGHMESMPSDCASCDMDGGADSGVCDGTECTIVAGSCGANSISSIPRENSWSSMAPKSSGGYFYSAASLYQSHFNFSIYRPPIA
jgi:hypothetical protein